MNMKICTDRKLYKYIKASMLFVLVFVVCFYSGNKEAKAEEDIITTHIWATKYDTLDHWEYCTLCGEVRNKIAHVWNDTWYLGREDCSPSNFCTRICDCGYNFQYRKAHGNLSGVAPHSCKLKHFQTCLDCGAWVNSPQCYDDEGYLTCLNTGVCKECGFEAKKENHFIIGGGYCRDCGKRILEYTTATVEYTSDYSQATIRFTMWTTDPRITLNGSMNNYNGIVNYVSKSWTSEKITDNMYNYTGVYVFNKNTQAKVPIEIGDVSWGVIQNGVGMFIESGLFSVPIWQDHEKPSITSIEQTNQKTYNDWATIKQLTIKGKEKLSAIVKIDIVDKETGDVIVKDAKASVINGEYTYVCTPPLEGPAEGREYICKVIDEIGNELEYPFTIYKTDSRYPMYRSEAEYTTWSQSKNIEFLFSDYGAGGVETSLNDQVSYTRTTQKGEDYTKVYSFTEENYGVTKYSLYMRDGLGNAGRTYVTIGKIDNTKPSVASAVVVQDVGKSVVRVTGDDFSRKMNAQGSGVAYYALVKNYAIPKDDEWKTSNEIEVTMPGKYYLWVKDRAGNIGDTVIVNINDDMSGDVNINNKLIYDKAKKENDSKNSQNADKIDGGDIKEYDETPATGDKMYMYTYIVMGLLSGIGIIIMSKVKINRV